ncbi:receptor-like protein kinase ANXUR1 [Actinidia eriantha]|uniref:receptor-like protein kinase ANXUR1 n=1 Tax=Actinidia eriantha TaxID=165200 RepID=UPI0025875D10|nr:receptor-like protein kinase ANXUR1 [Actinidia eriantha]
MRSNGILLFLICLSLLFNSIKSSSPDLKPLALICGKKDGGTDSDGRKWESDATYLVSADKSVEAAAQFQDPSLPCQIPYMNGRFFTSETTYRFPINGRSRYFLRFHFYPSSYPNFNTTNSYFSVVSGGVTLLNNFSAVIAAQALTQAYIMKEFSLAPLNSDSLSVTFKPSDKYNGSFAFVNGIEVMPSPNLFDSASMVGFEDQPLDTSSSHVQTMWRLNVGGQYIPPTNDSSSLARSWYDDTPYIYSGALGVTSQAENNVTIAYKNISAAIAPVEVYRTSRQMGLDGNVTRKFNLTWGFQVDANFTYLVRLHFCEYQLSNINERVFNIYINNQTAMEDADVLAWSGRPGIPIYKDYAIYVPETLGDEMLWLALWPDNTMRPEYFDAILNGLEIFKLSDTNSNLAGPNPTISDMMQKQLQEAAKRPFENQGKKTYTTALIGGAAGGAAAFAFVAVALLGYKQKKRLPGSESCNSSWLPLYTHSHTYGSKSTISGKSHGSTTISSDAAANCRYFSLGEIQHATKNFEESNVIGVGGFGKVYKGIIDGATKVAIKRSNPSSEQGVNEFQTEIEMLSKLRHRHLVSLIGFCEDNGEMILVYDYMGHGTLREHLYKGNKITLSWKQRLEICIGAARGLHYLHTGAKYTIIHRDVKTTNILLDEKWVAKVSDFGLSKTGPNMNQGHVSTVVKGSFGYLDPEYFRRQQLTEKSDVYSFGVVLFEVLCARPALNPSLPKEQVSLADWALHCQRKGTLEDIVDPQLKGKISPESLKKFAELAEKCLADHGTDRPSMGDVLWNLEFALQMQENPEGSSRRPPSGSMDYDTPEVINHSSFLAMHRNTLSLGSEHDEKESEDVPDDIIVNPKGQ